MRKTISRNKVGTIRTVQHTDIEINPNDIHDTKSQILKIEQEFNLQSPWTIHIPIHSSEFTIAPGKIIFAASTGQICIISLGSDEIVTYKVDFDISSIAYCEYKDCFFTAGERLRKVNKETMEVEAEYTGDVKDFVIEQRWGYGCKGDFVCRWKLEDMSEEELYEHQDVAKISVKNGILASISDGKLTVWQGVVIYTTENFTYQVKMVKISNRHIALCCDYQHILLFEIHTWAVKTILTTEYSCTYNCVDIDDQLNILVAAGRKSVVLYDLSGNYQEIYLIYNQKKYLFAAVVDGKIFAYSENSKVRIWEIPQFCDRKILNFDEEVKGISRNQIYFIWFGGKKLQVLDKESFEVLKVLEFAEEIWEVACFGEEIWIAHGNELEVFEEMAGKKVLEGVKPIFSICKMADKVIIGFSDRIQFFLPDFTLLGEFALHKSVLTCIHCTSVLYLGDSLGVIRVLDINTISETNSFEKHNDKVASIITFLDYLLSCSEDGKVNIYTIPDYHLIHSISSYKPFKIFPSTNNTHFYLFLRDGQIDIWDINDFSLTTSLKTTRKITACGLLPSETSIVVSKKKKIIILNNPITYLKIQSFGDNCKQIYNFQSKILKLIQGKPSKKLENYSNYLISPFQITPLILLCYFNQKDLLLPALEKNSFHPTSLGQTPLSIALSRNFIDSLNTIFKVFKGKLEKNPYSLYYVESTLLELNHKSVPNLHKLYQLAMGKSFLTTLPKFCENIKDLPIVLESSSIISDHLQFMPIENYSSLGKAIVFTQTYIRINTTLGSQDSLDFMESLLKCENKRIFDTPLIRIMLKEKWKKVKFVFAVQAATYALYIVALGLYSTKYQNESFLVFPFVISSLLLVYELFQMYSGVWDYLTDSWNLVDLCRAGLFLWYSIAIWKNSTDFAMLLSAVILLTWSRGITYFRLFSSTRYYINLLIQVIKDMVAFFLIFFYSIVGFGLVFHSFSNTTDYFPFLTDTYIINFGQMNTENYNKLQWFYFLLVTVLNPIIMLNLLISVMSDTYGRVQEDLAIADALELSCMIKEVELLMFWRRKIKTKKYLHICDLEQSENQSGNEQKMLKNVQKVIRDLSYEIKNSDFQISRNMDNVKINLNQHDSAISEIKQIVTKKFR